MLESHLRNLLSNTEMIINNEIELWQLMNSLYLVLILIILWIMGLNVLSPYINKTKHFQVYVGALLLWKSTKNRGVMDRVSGKSQKIIFSKIAVVIVFIFFILAMAVMIYGAFLGLTVKSTRSLSPAELLGLPGINPIIPIGYGIIAFAVSIMIHELFHGITARKHGIKVTSVGVMFFIVPLGAFVEPDESEINKADPVIKRRIIAAGPAINVVMALLALFILVGAMAPAMHQKQPGAYIYSVEPNSIYSNNSLAGMELISIGNYSGNSIVNLPYNSSLIPGKLYNGTFFDGTSFKNITIPAGVTIYGLISGYPAAASHLETGSIITSVNNKTVYNLTTLSNIFQNVTPGKSVYISTVYYHNNESKTYENTTVGTVSEYQYYESVDPSAATSSMKNVAFVGIEIIYSGMSLDSLNSLKQVISGSLTYQVPWYGFLETLSLPFSGLTPVPTYLAHMYTTPFSESIFFIFFNMLYWLFWVNILLAITNALPLVITDGHQFFRESLTILSRRKKFAFLRNKKVFDNIIIGINIVVLMLFLLEFLSVSIS